MKPNVIYFQEEKKFIKTSTDFILNEALFNVSKKGSFNVMLSGGSTPKKIYETLSQFPYKEKFPWEKTYFFLGDERILSPENTLTNRFMIEETLFSKIEIPSINIIFPDLNKNHPEKIAADYEKKIKDNMDLILLGIGADAHTASMFPSDLIWKDNEKLIISTSKPVGDPECYRISVGLPLINSAKNVLMLISGSEKVEITKELLSNIGEGINPLNSPISEISPKGEFVWHVNFTS